MSNHQTPNRRTSVSMRTSRTSISMATDAAPRSQSQRTSRTFHRITSIDGSPLSRGGIAISPSDLNLNLPPIPPNRQKPRRNSSWKITTNSASLNANAEEETAVRRDSQTRRSLSRPKRQHSDCGSLHDMELLQNMDYLECIDSTRESQDALERNRILERTNSNTKLNASNSTLNNSYSGVREETALPDYSAIPYSMSSPPGSTHFSTQSSLYARRFLDDDDEFENDHGPPETFQDEYNNNDTTGGGLGRHSGGSTRTERRDNRGARMPLMSDESMLDAMSVAHDNNGGSSIEFTTDLEWDPEIQRQQQDEWRKSNSRNPTLGSSTGNPFLNRRDLREVDQTINLMNASREENDSFPNPRRSSSKNTNNRDSSGNFMTQMNSSMVEIWLEKDQSNSDVSRPSTDGFKGRRRKKRRAGRRKRRKEPDKACISVTLLLLLVAAVAVVLAWVMGGLSHSHNDIAVIAANATTVANDTTATFIVNATTAMVNTTNATNDTTVVDGSASLSPFNWDSHHPEEEALLEQLKELLEKLNLVPSIPQFWEPTDPPRPQYWALHWVAHLAADPESVLATSNHQLDHPPAQAGSDSASDSIATISKEDSSRLIAYALAVLFYSTNGENPAFHLEEDPSAVSVWRKTTNWMQPVPLCEWQGIVCEENPFTDSTVISQLNLTNNNLQGTLPREVFQILFRLKVLDLSENHLTGSLPPEISIHLEEGKTTTPSLEALTLYRNKLTGTLPASWGDMTKLQQLRLDSNELDGSLPGQVNQLTDLKYLALHNNQFSGKFPYVEGLQSLEVLSFYGNHFSQELPYEIFRIPSLAEIRIQNNNLSGTIPPEIQNLHKLRILRLEDNIIFGSVPDFFDRLTNLTEIHIQRNKLAGPIPETFGSVPRLGKLLIDTNNFTGTIPSDLAKLTGLREFRAFSNDLTGSMPPSFCSLKDNNELKFVAIDCDKVTGCTCCDACV